MKKSLLIVIGLLSAFLWTLHAGEIGASKGAVRAKKIHHYLFTDGEGERIKTPAFLETDAFEGAQTFYRWSELEPQKDSYDFSLIEKDLKFLTAHNKKLFIQIEDVSFSPKRTNVPNYLMQDPQYHGGADMEYADEPAGTTTVVAYVSRRWDPAVQDRFHKLLNALGKKFDGRVEGINLEETSINDTPSSRQARGQEFNAAYRDGVLVNMKALKAAFPKSVTLQYANFMPGDWLPGNDHGYMRSVYEYARSIKVGVGGPDLRPYWRNQMNNSYGFIRESGDIVPVGIAVQEGNYPWVNPRTGQNATIADTIGFAEDYLKADYIFWCSEEPYYSKELIPYLRAQGNRGPNKKIIKAHSPARVENETAASAGESHYIYGLHDPGGENLFELKGLTGWIVFTEALGGTNHGSGDYSLWAQKGHGVIVRLNYGYTPTGTLPCHTSDGNFVALIRNFVSASKGSHIWIIGNEMNLQDEWATCAGAPEPITVSRYAAFFTTARSAIKTLPGHEQDQVIPGAISWRNSDYYRQLIAALGTGGLDGIAIHTYSQGNDPSLFSCAAQGLQASAGNKSSGFQAYRDRIDALPAWAKSLPIYITETRPRPWTNVNSGWVQNAYCEINEWNAVAANPKIRALVLFRWPAFAAQNSIQNMQEVQADLLQALNNAYAW